MPAATPDIHAIFNEALGRESDEDRLRYLDEACVGSPQLRQRVEALLRAHSEAGGFFGGQASVPPPTEIRPSTGQPGDTIGPYKLLQQIGEGGMGVVYMAEQTEPVERRVALKIIKPGMDTRQVIARFEAERQALAMMDHPNIARVLDAGTTGEGARNQEPGVRERHSDASLTPNSCLLIPADGRPYFVMELVKGIPITQYCDEHQLTPRERLELFLPVCQAVQHAHQKGIIHRDLKPSNVLVSEYDDRPVPKVIDFGVAKAVSQRLTEKTMFTQYGQVVGTLEYMSPEQAKLNELDVDTRSDVYSLGVLLYELLTGVTPLDKQRLKTAAFDEVLRIIREEEPQKPSTRLSTAETLPSIAANRKMEPKKLSGLLRGELDWIVMKALEKDRSRRYETANGLAADVLRYLADEPVSACPPSAGYRFKKFARRNKGLLTAVAVVSAALIAGTAVSTWQAVEASRQRDRALSAEGRAEGNLEEALSSVDSMLTRVADERLANVPMMEDVRRALYEDALQVYRRLAQQAGDDPQVRLETAKAQRRVGRILMLLGRNAEAESELEAAAGLLKAILDQTSADSQVEIELSHVRRLQGALLTATRESRIAHLSEAVEILQRHAGGPAAGRSVQLDLGDCLSVLANQQRQRGDHPGALANFEAAERVFVALVDSDPEDREAAMKYAKHLQNFGVSFEWAGDWTNAASKFANAAEVARARVDSDPREAEARYVLAVALLNQANVLMRQAEHAKADALYSKSRTIMEQLVRDYPSFPEYRLRLSATLMNACGSASKLDEPDRAIAHAEQAVDVLEYLTNNWPEVREYHANLGGALSNLAWMLCVQETDTERAEALAQRAIQEGRLTLESSGDASNFLMKSHHVLANAQMQLGRWSEARATCLAGLEVAETLKKKRPDDPDVSGMTAKFQKILEAARQIESEANP